jgi:hypothetical protein
MVHHHNVIAAALLQSGRCNLDAEGRPDLHNPGFDDSPMVIGEHLQLPLDQGLHVLEDVGKVARGSRRIGSQVAFGVLLKLPLSILWRSAGHVPGGTGGVQSILPLLKRITHPDESGPHFQDHLGHLALG